MKKISIIIPVYNEADTFDTVIKNLEQTDFCSLEKEIIIVDDCSNDGTIDLYKNYPYKIVYHKQNMGKGAAVRSGLSIASGDIIVIQDADLEYNPQDYNILLPEILRNKTEVCYGSRFLDKDSQKLFSPLQLFANKFLTFLTKFLYHSNLTDMETCYKAFSKNAIKSVHLSANGFDIEPEITAMLLKNGYKIIEKPISYTGRSKLQGKKIRAKDGLYAIGMLIKKKFS